MTAFTLSSRWGYLDMNGSFRGGSGHSTTEVVCDRLLQ